MSFSSVKGRNVGILSCIFLLFFLQCGISSKNDIYKILPKGTFLTKSLLLKSKQILKNHDDLILIVNISTDIERFDPHLLFFDSTLHLYSASYFPSERVEAIENNLITAVINKHRNGRKSSYRNELPNKYKLNLIDMDGEIGQMCNKIIDTIILDKKYIKFRIRKANDIYAGVSWSTLNKDTSIFESFIMSDSLKFSLNELNLDYEEGVISFRKLDSSNGLIWDKMIVTDSIGFDNFYEQLFKSLSSEPSVQP